MISKEEIFSQLQEVLEQLDIKLKYDRGYFKGGFFRYKQKSIIYLNRAESVEQYISIILSELKNMDLSNVSMSPSLRAIMQSSSERIGG
jgi:hypothetical protein